MDVEEGSRKFEEKNFYEKLTLIPSQNVGFWPNSTPKASSKGEGCPSLMYFNLTLSLADVGFGFFPIYTSQHSIMQEYGSIIQTIQHKLRNHITDCIVIIDYH